ncbi:hypothetical protein V6B08_00355 [Ferrovibrio sp. MS7]|jgi:hypothetical protein|uniref:hypothetical protein n=1 Tax=Ferrovibrio TaxID=1231242 RepID=UPI0031349942
MAIALLSLRQAQKAEPRLKAALNIDGERLEAPLTARERMEMREGIPSGLTPRQYVQGLSAKLREQSREQMAWALGRVETAELDTLVRQIAKMKGRYATLLLEYAQGDRPMRPTAAAELKGLREQIAEMEYGFEMLKEAILEGTAEVIGVRAVE